MCERDAPNGASFGAVFGNGCADQGTFPVASFRPNAFGLHDMHGNVYEWVADCYRPSYDSAPPDGSARTDWTCRSLILQGSRAVRGGSWSGYPRNMRSAIRVRDAPRVRVSLLGFRVARTL